MPAACERVEFAPAFEGLAVDKLLTVETGTTLSMHPAPDLHGDPLPSGVRRNLPGQTMQMPLDLTPCTDRLRQQPQIEDIEHDPFHQSRQPMKKDDP